MTTRSFHRNMRFARENIVNNILDRCYFLLLLRKNNDKLKPKNTSDIGKGHKHQLSGKIMMYMYKLRFVFSSDQHGYQGCTEISRWRIIFNYVINSLYRFYLFLYCMCNIICYSFSLLNQASNSPGRTATWKLINQRIGMQT